jgi:hypothetical protein
MSLRFGGKSTSFHFCFSTLTSCPATHDGKAGSRILVVRNRVETILLQERKIRGAQRKDICDCKGTMHPEYEEQSGDNVIKLLNGFKELTLKNAGCAIWILDDMPDSEEGPHNKTAGQRAIS